MRLPKRDVMATGLVAVAGVLYGLWAADSALPGLDSVRATGVVVLGLGFVASASAVVPGFDQLIHGNRIYLAATSFVGLVALAGGIWMLVAASEVGLGLLVGTMGLLWLVATVHHVLLAKASAGGVAATSAPPSAPPRRTLAEKKDAA